MIDFKATLATSLHTLLGDNATGDVDKYADLLGKAGIDDVTVLSSIKNDTDAESLSDVELYEIANKLLEYLNNNPALDDTIQQEIYQLTQLISQHIAEDNKISKDGNDESLNPSKLLIDVKKELANGADTKPDMNSKIFHITQAGLQLLSPEEQAVLLEHYDNINSGYSNYLRSELPSISKKALDIQLFFNLTESLPKQDEDGTDINPNKSIQDFFDEKVDNEYLINKDLIFEALADGNSALYDAADGDITDTMEFIWGYLAEQGETEQKEFLAKIPPYSPVHLSLLETIQEKKADIDHDSRDRQTRAEIRYLENLEALSQAIVNGDEDFDDVDLDKIFPSNSRDKDDVVKDIFGNVEDIREDVGDTENFSTFIKLAESGSVDASDVVAYLETLSDDEIADFAAILTSDFSPILTLLQQNDGIEKVDSLMAALFTALTDEKFAATDDDSKSKRQIFLENIDDRSDLFDFIEKSANVEFSEAIEDQDFSDFTDDEILDFINNDLQDATKLWYSSAITDDYIEDLSNADDERDIKRIFDKAEKEGALESVIFAMTSDTFEENSPEFYNALFSYLDKDRQHANLFFESIDPSSFLGRSLTKLIDEEQDPFVRISYDIDRDTGKLDFGNDQSRLLRILSKRDQEGVNLLSETIKTLEATYHNAAGSDSRDIQAIIDAVHGNDLNDQFFDEIFNIADNDLDKAEDLLLILTDDTNILFKDLNEEQLEDFLDKFIDWIKDKDDILEIFGDYIDEDSLIYKALISAGADPEDHADSDYTAFISGARNLDDAASFINSFISFGLLDDTDSLDFVSEQLRGTDGRDIGDAVENIIKFSTASPEIFIELIEAINRNDPIIANLTPDQSEELVKEVFKHIIDQDLLDEDDFLTDNASDFLESIPSNSIIADFIRRDYPILAYELKFTNYIEDDFDDQDIANELEDLLKDRDLISAISNRSNGRNENMGDDNRRSSGRSRGRDDDFGFREDDDFGFREDDDFNNNRNNNRSDRSSNSNRSSGSNSQYYDTTSSEETFKNSTEAALSALSRYHDVAGEPDYDTNIFSSFFLENNSIKSLAETASDNNFSTQATIGLLQLIPLDQQADFIRHFMAQGNVDQETQDYLIGRLLIMRSNNEIGNRTFEKTLEDAGINGLTQEGLEDIINNWSDIMARYTDASISSIDDTHEAILANASNLVTVPSEQNPNQPFRGNGPIPQNPNGLPPQNPYGGGGFAPYGGGGFNPYGGGGFDPYGGGGFNPYGGGGFNPYGGGGGFNTPYGINASPFSAQTLAPAPLPQAAFQSGYNVGQILGNSARGAAVPGGLPSAVGPINAPENGNLSANKQAIREARQRD